MAASPPSGSSVPVRTRPAASKGLGRKSSAPISIQRRMAPVSSTAEIITTGICWVLASDLRRRRTSNPSMPGMTISSRIKSGCCSLTASRASAPSAAEVVVCPARSKACSSIRRLIGSSSTIRIVPSSPKVVSRLGAGKGYPLGTGENRSHGHDPIQTTRHRGLIEDRCSEVTFSWIELNGIPVPVRP
jgi:hypothetical protein